MLKIYVDASTKGNPGPSAGGIVIVGNQLHKQLHVDLGTCSNHEAEFKIFIYALNYLIDYHFTDQTVLLHSDSKIVIQTVEKKFTKNSTFQPYLDQFNTVEKAFSLLLVKWIPESQNKGADTLARQALQKYLALH